MVGFCSLLHRFPASAAAPSLFSSPRAILSTLPYNHCCTSAPLLVTITIVPFVYLPKPSALPSLCSHLHYCLPLFVSYGGMFDRIWAVRVRSAVHADATCHRRLTSPPPRPPCPMLHSHAPPPTDPTLAAGAPANADADSAALRVCHLACPHLCRALRATAECHQGLP
jgi:hypothetical protein